MYAVGQFVNGQLADRFGSRFIASLGVLGSVSMNIAVFLVTLLLSPETTSPRTILLLVVIFWGANGFFQAMGWTPMVRIMAHWFSSENRGKVMGFFGTQDNTFMSIDTWRHLLKEGFMRFIEVGHEFGCQVAHHTCGCVTPLLPDMVECGLDIINPLQPDCAQMDY